MTTKSQNLELVQKSLMYPTDAGEQHGQLAFAAYFASKNQRYNFRKRQQAWKNAAGKFGKDIGVESAMTLQDFDAVVNFHPEKRIVVFSTANWTVLNDGVFTGTAWLQPSMSQVYSPTDDEHTIWILQDHSTGKFYWIRCIGGLRRETDTNAGHKFCPLCFEWLRDNFECHRCIFKFRCIDCGTSSYQQYADLEKHRDKTKGSEPCSKCGKQMAVGECMKRHESWCTKSKPTHTKCDVCEETYPRSYNHQCEKTFCSNCRDFYGKGEKHRCFLGPDPRISNRSTGSQETGSVEKAECSVSSNSLDSDNNPSSKDDTSNDSIVSESLGTPSASAGTKKKGSQNPPPQQKTLHYAYDLECMLVPHETIPGRSVHKVNLVMVYPLHAGDQGEMLTFTDLDSFFSWVLQRQRGRCSFWAHNAKGYDNRFLYEHLTQHMTSKLKNVCWRGCKLISFTVKNRKFRDSMCHMQRALYQLPSMLALDVPEEKGFFPHCFNTPEYQEYVGVIPEAKFYKPDRMSTERKAKFLEWYESVKNCTEWNLQAELRRYCKSDVMVLCRALEAYDKKMQNLNGGLSPLTKATLPSYSLYVFLNLHIPMRQVVQLTKAEYEFCCKALRGGKTDARRLFAQWSEDEIASGNYGVHVDIQSMYPNVQYRIPMPVGIPKWKRFTDNNQPTYEFLKDFMGIIHCDIKPTQYTFHPVIGACSKETGKLQFNLVGYKDIHLTSVEVQEALKNGYEVSKVRTILEFESSTDIFQSFVRTMLKVKVESSGMPAGGEAAWQLLKDRHEKELGIVLEREKMVSNKGMREMAKLMLNSLWGKFAQKPDLAKSEHLTKQGYNDLLLKAAEGDVQLLDCMELPQNRGVMAMYKDSVSVGDLKDKNVAVAVFVAAGGRLSLGRELAKRGEDVLYYDTDSIIYERDPAKADVDTGLLLGEWSDENPSDPITRFVALGPKSYGYQTLKGKTIVKSKGFTMSDENAQVITLDAMQDMVLDYKNGVTSTLPTSHTHFGYSRHGHDTFTEQRSKQLRVTANKNYLDKATLKTYPFGWEKYPECPLNNIVLQAVTEETAL